MNILVVNSSAQGASSISTDLTRYFADRLQLGNRAVRVKVRDIGSSPVPHLLPETVAGIRGTAQTEAELRTLELSDELVAELQEADVVVIGAPMYNFGIASTLKSWFDHVLRARVTFRYTESGPEGLLKGKRAVVIESRGGVYSEGPGAAMDHQEPHLRTMLAVMGIEDVTFVRAEGVGFGLEAAALAVEAVREQLGRVAVRDLALAA